MHTALVSAGLDDRLPGYTVTLLEITDPDVLAISGQTHHPLVAVTGDPADSVAGTVFVITDAELVASDAYEVDDYQRVLAPLASGDRPGSTCRPHREHPGQHRAGRSLATTSMGPSRPAHHRHPGRRHRQRHQHAPGTAPAPSSWKHSSSTDFRRNVTSPPGARPRDLRLRARPTLRAARLRRCQASALESAAAQLLRRKALLH